VIWNNTTTHSHGTTQQHTYSSLPKVGAHHTLYSAADIQSRWRQQCPIFVSIIMSNETRRSQGWHVGMWQRLLLLHRLQRPPPSSSTTPIDEAEPGGYLPLPSILPLLLLLPPTAEGVVEGCWVDAKGRALSSVYCIPSSPPSSRR